MTEKIIFEANGNTGKIILNNPEKLNAFDFEAIKLLDKLLDKIGKSALKAVIITGSGSSFCAGADISWEKSIGSMPRNKAKQQVQFVQHTISKIETMPQIFIATINGYAVGGGNELAMACDIRIATENAKFLHPEVTLGTVAPLGATKRLPRLIGPGKAKYLLFTGETIGSKTALEWGLVDFVVSEKNLDYFLNSILSKITRNPKKAMELTKKSVNQNYLMDLRDSFEAESYIQCSRSKENKKLLEDFLKKKKG